MIAQTQQRAEPGQERDPGGYLALVPSLLLQPLVENAIKHGVGPSLAHTRIRISARRRDGRLWLAVENDLDANAPRRAGGRSCSHR